MRGGGAASLKPRSSVDSTASDGVAHLFGHDCGYLLEFATGAVHSTSAAVSLSLSREQVVSCGVARHGVAQSRVLATIFGVSPLCLLKEDKMAGYGFKILSLVCWLFAEWLPYSSWPVVFCNAPDIAQPRRFRCRQTYSGRHEPQHDDTDKKK